MLLNLDLCPKVQNVTFVQLSLHLFNQVRETLTDLLRNTIKPFLTLSNALLLTHVAHIKKLTERKKKGFQGL